MDFTNAERAHYIVRYLAKKKGITQAQVGELIGYSNKSALSAVLSGKRVMPKKFGAKLASLDPEVNPAFLDGTSNEPLRSVDASIQLKEEQEHPAPTPQIDEIRPGSIVIPPELAQMITALSLTIQSQQETIRAQQETIRRLTEKGEIANVG